MLLSADVIFTEVSMVSPLFSNFSEEQQVSKTIPNSMVARTYNILWVLRKVGK